MITIDCEYYICSCPLIALLLEISSALPRDCCQASLQESGMPVFHVCRFEMSVPSGCCLFTLSSYQVSAEFFITVSLFLSREGIDGFMEHLIPFCIILNNPTSPAEIARN